MVLRESFQNQFLTFHRRTSIITDFLHIASTLIQTFSASLEQFLYEC